MPKFDALWYLPAHRSRVLSLLNYPNRAERDEREVYGVVWAPGQPRPKAATSGPGLGWSLVFGNFLGYEPDPDRLTAQMELSEIEPGLVAGVYVLERVQDDANFETRKADQVAFEAQKRADLARLAAEEVPEVQDSGAELRFLILMARAHGCRKPELLSFEDLSEFFRIVCLGSAWIDEGLIGQYLAEVASSETPMPAAPAKRLDVDDQGANWEEPMRAIYTKMVKQKNVKAS